MSENEKTQLLAGLFQGRPLRKKEKEQSCSHEGEKEEEKKGGTGHHGGV